MKLCILLRGLESQRLTQFILLFNGKRNVVSAIMIQYLL